MLKTVRQLDAAITAAINDIYAITAPADATFETTRDIEHGDLTTAAAMRLAKTLRKPPAAIANELADALRNKIAQSDELSGKVGAVETAGGFVNVKLSRAFWLSLALNIIDTGENYGKNYSYEGKAQVEFVSANPTGPLTVAHGRQAAVGDTLARILDFAGYASSREYYINDTGNQINILGKSVYYRYLESKGVKVDYPEECYQGDYIHDIAKRASLHIGSRLDSMGEQEAINAFGDFAKNEILEWNKQDLVLFGVHFDSWFSQAQMESGGQVEKLLAEYSRLGMTYQFEGATWIKSEQFGDVKDKVLIKSDGSYTYRTPDIAYHQGKFARGFDKLIVLLGPDHHAHTITMKAALQALGLPAERLNYILVQHCTLYDGETQIQMSTRRGTYITLKEVVDAVGVDAARFFFLNRSCDSHLDFDLALARKQSSDNPVFYLQYAAARCASILRKAMEDGYYFEDEAVRGYYFRPSGDFGGQLEDDEIAVLQHLGRFPVVVARSASTLDILKLINFLTVSVENFHNYYQRRRVMTEDRAISRDRLAIIATFRTVLENGLRLLGVSAPERM